MKIILADSYNQAINWAEKTSRNANDCLIVTAKSGDEIIRGRALNYKTDKVVYLGMFSEEKNALLRCLLECFRTNKRAKIKVKYVL